MTISSIKAFQCDRGDRSDGEVQTSTRRLADTADTGSHIGDFAGIKPTNTFSPGMQMISMVRASKDAGSKIGNDKSTKQYHLSFRKGRAINLRETVHAARCKARQRL